MTAKGARPLTDRMWAVLRTLRDTSVPQTTTGVAKLLGYDDNRKIAHALRALLYRGLVKSDGLVFDLTPAGYSLAQPTSTIVDPLT